MADLVKKVFDETGITRIVQGSEEDDDDSTIVSRAFAAALYPFQLAISPTAIKSYLTVILFLITSIGLVTLSTTAYTFFYYQFIPQTSLERPIYLQYAAGKHPRAQIPLHTHALISEQQYEVSVTLHMPRTPSNLAAGNFMLDMVLHSDADALDDTVLDKRGIDAAAPAGLRRSSRSAILPYSSRLTRLATTLLRLPVHLFSLHDIDSVTLHVPMFEELEFKRGKHNIPTWVELEIQSQPSAAAVAACVQPLSDPASPQQQIQVYSAKVNFQVRFHGLRYWIYNYRTLSFVIFTSLFYTVSISTLTVAWAALAAALHVYKHPTHTPPTKQGRKTIKQETTTTDTDLSSIKSEPAQDEPRAAHLSLLPHTRAHTHADSPQPNHAPANEANLPHDSPTTTDHADDEDDGTPESEDEWEQLRRIQARMAREMAAKQQQQQQQRGGMQHDSGIGTSMESEGRASGSGLSRRRSDRERSNNEIKQEH